MVLTAAPIKQINHKYINRSIESWLDIHFGDTSFNGRVIIGHRKQQGGIYTMSARPLTELRPYIKMIHASQRLDYYITANTVSGVNRRKEELFGLQNIVIDIDCHEEGRHHYSASELVQAFIWRSKRDLWSTGVIPTPNSIVRTGRGVQLWWALKPCYGGSNYGVSLHYHEEIKDNLMNHIESMLGEYSDELEGLSIDRGASSNLVGYFRMPYTYNTTAKCYSSLEILHDERYDQRELIKIEKASSTEGYSSAVREEMKHIPMKASDRTLLRNFKSIRVMQLINLRNLRNNDVGSEMRDHFNFSVYNALRMAFDHQEAMIHLEAYNAGFKKPMSRRELENCVSSAKDKEGYKYTNAKLIEFLEITEEEQKAIGLLPSSEKRRSKPNASRDAARKALKADRDSKILELAEKGVSQAETARILGIGKNTVNRVLKSLREDKKEISEPIVIEIFEEDNRHQNGSIYVLNNSRTMSTLAHPLGLFDMPEYDSS